MQRPLWLTVLSIACCIDSSIGTVYANADDRPAIGTEVKEFSFTDIRYLPRTLSDVGDRKAYVLVFTTLDCPIVKRSLPKLRKLDEAYRDQGVQFVAINVGPRDAVVDVASQALQPDIEFPFAKDFTGEVVAQRRMPPWYAASKHGRFANNPSLSSDKGFVPGGESMVLDSGIGFCIPAGSVVGLQIHYVTTGEAATDQTAVGFVFAKEAIQKQLRHFQCHTGRFAIPPGASHHEVKAGTRTFQRDATGIGMFSRHRAKRSRRPCCRWHV